MIRQQSEIIKAHKRDGSTLDIVVPVRRCDVEMQPGIPAHVLATLAFSKRVDGVRRWSEYTRQTLRRIEEQYGEQTMRNVLGDLLDDIATGFRPHNPIGILIHRVRCSANSGDMMV